MSQSLLAASPQEAVDRADEAFNRGDLDAMLAFYEEDAIMLFAPGQAVRGRDALREALLELLALKPVASHHAIHVIESDDLALWNSAWTVTGTAPDGAPVELSGSNAVIFRKGPDGGWRVAIENPWGSAVLNAPDPGRDLG
jgi:uncharacterized protein (TIGR02246 family)